MTPFARLQAALDLVETVAEAARPVDAVVSNWLRARRGLNDDDRGYILNLLSEVLRHHARLGWWLDHLGAEDTPRNRLFAWLTLGEGKSADQVRRVFDDPRNGAATLNASETAMLNALKGRTLEHPDMPAEVRLECPDWAMGSLRHRFGDAFEAEMRALLADPPLDLRVNTIKSTRDAMLRELSGLGLRAEASPLAPHGIRIGERLSLARLAPLKTGALEIQDEGSQLVALLVDATPGERVVDFCAGAGGKTLAFAAQMENKGRVVSCDVSEGRLKRCAERARKAGLHNIQTRLLTSETDRWIKRHKAGFDRVLVDAPCSGTGTWRRNPDARWRAPEEEGVGNLVALQSRILRSAARLVKPGGRLVYATCSLLREENEDQIAAFLAAQPSFSVVPLDRVAPQIGNSAHPEFLSLTPARHDTDGFFAAVLVREG